MKPKELSEAIRQGINKSRDDLFKEINKALFILIAFVIIFILIGNYQTYRWEKENCGEDGCPIPTVAATPDNCDKPWVHCKVFKESNVIFEKDFCGYSESDSWFLQYSRINNHLKNINIECDN